VLFVSLGSKYRGIEVSKCVVAAALDATALAGTLHIGAEVVS